MVKNKAFFPVYVGYFFSVLSLIMRTMMIGSSQDFNMLSVETENLKENQRIGRKKMRYSWDTFCPCNHIDRKRYLIFLVYVLSENVTSNVLTVEKSR